MIEIPTRDGYYYAQDSRSRTHLLRRYGCGWWHVVETAREEPDRPIEHIINSYGIVRIEPVAPPSWDASKQTPEKIYVVYPESARTWNRALRGAYGKGYIAAKCGYARESPYPDKRKPNGKLTWSRSFETAWYDGYDAAEQQNKRGSQGG